MSDMIKQPASYLVLFFAGLLLLLSSSCVEELDADRFIDPSRDGLLVVDAQLTDEIKIQEVVLSRSQLQINLERDTIYDPYMPFGRDGEEDLDFETGAEIYLQASEGRAYVFNESSPGKYRSEVPFALEPGMEYTLKIQTGDGKLYMSDPLEIEGEAEISALYAERHINAEGTEGVQIYVDSKLLDGETTHLRFAYEETYKIVAPFWSPDEFKLTDYKPCDLPVPTYNLELAPKEIDNRVCYNTVESTVILQETLSVTQGGEARRYPLRFIPKDNFIITHRYSILLRQLNQSSEAYSYYKTLDEISKTPSVFTQVQPGTLTANVSRVDGTNEDVLGFIETARVKEQRIYFSYQDFFPEAPLPEYPIRCFEQSSPESHQSYCSTDPSSNSCPPSIIELVNQGKISHVRDNVEFIGECPGPYTYVIPECGDCTFLGEIEKPEFWKD